MKSNLYADFEVRPATATDVAAVFYDRREPFDVRHDQRAKAIFLSNLPDVFFVSLNGKPAAVVLVRILCAKVAEISMITTGAVEGSKRGFYEGTKRFLDDLENGLGLARLECCCFADHEISLKYLERVGFVREGIMRKRWNGSTDVVMLARVR